MKKAIFSVLFSLLVSFLFLSTVSAFGIGSSYYTGHPLEIAPGETADVSLGMQNMVGDQNITVVANLTKGSEIARITDTNAQYFIPLGSNNQVSVNVRVTIPSSDPIGKTYNVEVTIITVTSGQGGGVVFGQSIAKSFPVLVKSAEQEIPTTEEAFPVWILIVIIVIILAIIIWLLLRKKPAKKRK
jgi:hypothetical protein